MIRPLDAEHDLPLVRSFYAEAPDFWLLAEGVAPDEGKARAFFTDCPPGCDIADSHRLGLFVGNRLTGLAELCFGFPQPDDAYLGLMIIGPWAQGRGHGRRFLIHVETLARQAESQRLYLAVLDTNPRASAFWSREGFRLTCDTGLTERGDTLRRMVKGL